MKKTMYILLVLLFIYFLFTLIAPPLVIKDKNKVLKNPKYKVSAKAKKLYTNLDFVADLHCDALLWKRDLTKKVNYGHVDFVRMQENNVAFQNFTIVTKSPKGQNFDKNDADAFDRITPLTIGQGQPVSTWFSLLNRCLYQCRKLEKFATKFDNQFLVIKSKEDFRNFLTLRKSNNKIIGGMLGIEGAHCLEGKIENFDKVYNAGVRMLGPAHFFDNELGGSAHGIKKGGLSKFGFEVLKKMQERNMIVDVAHSSEKVIDEILANYEGPILSSHTGAQGMYNTGRNLSDKHIKAIVAKNGLIGIAFFKGCIGSIEISDIVKTMHYVKELVGSQYIALGSDFDGSVVTPFDITGLNLLIDEMLKQNFTDQEIKDIMGENVKKYLLANLPPEKH